MWSFSVWLKRNWNKMYSSFVPKITPVFDFKNFENKSRLSYQSLDVLFLGVGEKLQS